MAQRDKLPVVTARPFAFIGPYQGLDKPWAVNNFLRDALLGVPIRILGDADTVRSYMYPSDMAFWLLAILAEGVARHRVQRRQSGMPSPSAHSPSGSPRASTARRRLCAVRSASRASPGSSRMSRVRSPRWACG